MSARTYVLFALLLIQVDTSKPASPVAKDNHPVPVRVASK